MTDQLRLEGLLHEPYGAEHPYEQLPTERFPRDPLAGEPTVVGVATWPAGAAEAAWATWVSPETGAEGRAEAEWSRDDGERSYWRVQLPAFPQGERISYRLHAHEGDRCESSDAYTFVAAGWRPVGDVIDYRLAADRLELECVDAAAATIQVTVALLAPHVLRLGLASPHHSPAPFIAPHHPPAMGGTRGVGEGEGVCSRGEPAARPLWTVQEVTAERLAFAASGLRLVVHRRPCRLELQRPDGTVLLAEAAPLSRLVGQGGRALRVRRTFASPSDEAFYGLGERYNALDQRGKQLDVRVYDQYRRQGRRTYLPVPFFVSSQGYGMYLATSRHATYDLAASWPDRWLFDAELGPAGDLESYLFVGEPQQAIAAFTDLVGKPALPPAWAFGPWMSGNEWNSQATVLEQVQRTTEHGIPATVLVIEAWSDEATFYIWNDSQYTPRTSGEPHNYHDFVFPAEGRWPDPKSMVDELHRLGIRVVLWQVPVMKRLDVAHPQHDGDEAHMVAHGYCVHDASGRPYRIRSPWFRDGLVLDFTNPQAVQWWLSKRAYLLDELSIDGFKTDGGEHLWGRDLRFADGRRGDELWNEYPNLYVDSYHRFAREKRQGDALTFSRSGFAGAQRSPCHWAGDQDSTWDSFRVSILAGLNAGISGIPFWGWDMAGFSGEIPSAELYLRAVAMAAFCPIMQYHSDFNGHRLPCRDRTPWNIQARTGDPDVIPVFRYYANLRLNLFPYIYSEAKKSSETGLPLMRALPLAFPGERAAGDFPYQYLFGESLLVAPVVTEGCTSQAVYLPGGEWCDFWTGRAHSGPRVVMCSTPKGRIPVFVRAGAILPLNLDDTHALGSPVGNAVDRYQHLCLRIYPWGESCYAWHDHVSAATHVVRCTAGDDEWTVAVHLPPMGQDLSLAIYAPAPSAVCVDGLELAQAGDPDTWRQGPADAWCYAAADACTLVRLASGPAREVKLR